MIPHRRLGSSGPEVSALGFGAAVLSGSYGAADRQQAMAVLECALDLGVTFFDTADVYGNGENEEIIGRAIGGRRTEVVLATKVGIQRSGDRRVSRVNGRPDHILRSCETSLRRLGVEVIDLYYLHRVDPQVPIEDSVGAMASLVAAGKVRHIGLSEVAPRTLHRAHAVHPIAVLQTEYSLWSRDCERELLPTCRALGVGFVAYCPLGRGFLTGGIPANGRFAIDDIRHRIPRFSEANLERNTALLGALRAMAANHGCTLGQLALAWLLNRGGDVIPIPGTRNADHLKENVAATAVSLSPADNAALDVAFPVGAATGERYPAELLARLGL